MSTNNALVLDKMKEAGKPLKSKDLVDLTGLAKEEIAKVIKTLKKDGKVISPKNCYYAAAE